MLNTMRDMLGYHFIPYDNAPIKENAPDAPEATKQKITDRNLEVVYTPPVSNGITWDSVGYPALKCLYYKLDD
jgi:hypothetical protein